MQEPSQASLKKLAVRGTFWTVASYGSGIIIRLGGNLALTRLLSPEIFGLMALVRTFVTGLEFFSDVGLKPNIVRSKRGDEPAFLNTAWTIQILRGGVIEICCLLLTWPVAQFYDEPKLLIFIPVVGTAAFCRSFASTSQHTFSRRLDVRTITLLQLSQQLVSVAVMIAWAFFISRSTWALVIGTWVAALYLTLMSHYITPKDLPANRLAWDKEAAREIFSFGRWIFIGTALTFLESQIDRFILGKALTLTEFGIYSQALLISSLPQQIVMRWSQQVLMPVFSRKVDLPREQLRKQMWKPRLLFTVGIGSLISVLAVFADVFIDLLYDDRYQQVGWILSILAFGIWPRVLTATIAPLLLMMGKSSYSAFGNLVKVVYLIVLLPLVAPRYGFLGIAIVVTLNDYPYYFVMQWGLMRERMPLLLQDLVLTLLITAPLALMVLLRWLLGFGLPFSGIPGI